MIILSFPPTPPPGPWRIQTGTRSVPSLNSSLIYCFFLWNQYTRREESNIFANGAAKWAPALKIVEYPEVTGAVFCHIIPLCFKRHHSKCERGGASNGAAGFRLQPLHSGWTRRLESEAVQLLRRPVKTTHASRLLRREDLLLR